MPELVAQQVLPGSPSRSVETSAFASAQRGPLFTELSSTGVVRGGVDAFAWLEGAGSTTRSSCSPLGLGPPPSCPALLAGSITLGISTADGVSVVPVENEEVTTER